MLKKTFNFIGILVITVIVSGSLIVGLYFSVKNFQDAAFKNDCINYSIKERGLYVNFIGGKEIDTYYMTLTNNKTYKISKPLYDYVDSKGCEF